MTKSISRFAHEDRTANERNEHFGSGWEGEHQFSLAWRGTDALDSGFLCTGGELFKHRERQMEVILHVNQLSNFIAQTIVTM
jgi:hypothetical protein